MTGLEVSFAGAFIAGLLSFLSPCVLPLVPPYLCFIGGVSLSDMTAEGGPPKGANLRVVSSAVFFVGGFTLVFVLFGATASFLGQLLTDNMVWIGRVAGVLIIIMGVHFLGIVRIPLLYREARFDGPVLAAILMFAGMEDSVTHGVALLTSYALGIGVPFLLVAAAIGPALRIMPGVKRHMGKIEKTIGVLLVLTGVLFLTGGIADIAYWLLETFPVLGKVG